MTKNTFNAIQKAKIIISAMLAIDLIYFFLPLNIYGNDMVSLLNIISGAANPDSVFSADMEYYFGTAALAVNIAVFIGAVFVRKNTTFRAICLPNFLATAIVLGFCWGMLIDKTGFVPSLYSFGLLYLLSTIICAATVLNLNEKT
jgi:uncharacterized membrane protein (UPF0182 family)